MTRGSCEGRERNREGVAGAEAETHRRIRAAQMRELSTAGIGIAGGAACTD